LPQKKAKAAHQYLLLYLYLLELKQFRNWAYIYLRRKVAVKI